MHKHDRYTVQLVCEFILEWTKLVCTPAPGTLFVIHSLRMSMSRRTNYVPLFGVDTDLRNTLVIRDVIVI